MYSFGVTYLHTYYLALVIYQRYLWSQMYYFDEVLSEAKQYKFIFHNTQSNRIVFLLIYVFHGWDGSNSRINRNFK